MKEFQLDEIEAGGALAILAGHYCVASELVELSASGVAEENSFLVGVQIFRAARERGAKATLTVWINDIGIDVVQRQALKESHRLPDNYLRILDRAGVDSATLGVQFESSTRNKASAHVKKWSARKPGLFRRVPSDAQGLVRCVESCSTADEAKLAYVIDGPDGEALVVKDGPHPKCNLILATLFDDVTWSASADTVVTLFNGIYVNRIRLGMYVANRLLGLKAGFLNLYTFEDDTCREGEGGKCLRVAERGSVREFAATS